jgi:hypothetical protein
MLMTLCAQADTLPLNSSYTKKMRRPPDGDSCPDFAIHAPNAKRARLLSIVANSVAWNWHNQGALRWIVDCFAAFKLNVEIRRYDKEEEAYQRGHSTHMPNFEEVGNWEVTGARNCAEKIYVLRTQPLLPQQGGHSFSSSSSARSTHIPEDEDERWIAMTRETAIEVLNIRKRLQM